MNKPVQPQAIAELYNNHHGWLRGLLRRRLGCADTAADLAQDTFLRLIIRPRRFDSFREERAYLSAIARGLCVDLWRRREIEQAWLSVLESRPQAIVPSAEHQAAIIETLYEVDAMLSRLPDNVADAFVMAQIHGMTYKRIADRLGVSERMVKKYMARAMFHCAMIEAGMEAGN